MHASVIRIDWRRGGQVAFLVIALISGLLGGVHRVSAADCGSCGVDVAASSAHDCCAGMPADTEDPALGQGGSCDCSLQVPAENTATLASGSVPQIQLGLNAPDVEARPSPLPESFPHPHPVSPHPPGAPLYLAHAALLI